MSIAGSAGEQDIRLGREPTVVVCQHGRCLGVMGGVGLQQPGDIPDTQFYDWHDHWSQRSTTGSYNETVFCLGFMAIGGLLIERCRCELSWVVSRCDSCCMASAPHPSPFSPTPMQEYRVMMLCKKDPRTTNGSVSSHLDCLMARAGRVRIVIFRLGLGAYGRQ